MIRLFTALLLFCAYHTLAFDLDDLGDCQPGDPRCTGPKEEFVLTKSPTYRKENGYLDSLLEDVMEGKLKFVFVGGKGGVGKTTTSSAIATLLSATANQRVLLVSTDPAHSLGDAWRTKFTNSPSSPFPGLDILEIDPKETMDAELSTWIQFAKEFEGDNADSGDSGLMKQITGLQEWLSGIPGIDEATALTAAITNIESGKYDVIVFDTAPTGHTIKLLALPGILEQGIAKLESWQTTLWSYWDIFKGFTMGGGAAQAGKKRDIKAEVTQKLMDYKTSIQKVAAMLQDQERTRFVVVCIAEFLSVSETQRLLQDLAKYKVRASHIVVNQLVIQDALSSTELNQLSAMAKEGDHKMDQDLLDKAIKACSLTTSRKAIQKKYLDVLKGYPETQGILEGICEVPLLATEVTGTNAIGHFSQWLVSYLVHEGRDITDNELLLHIFGKGDIVRLQGEDTLDRSKEGLEGVIEKIYKPGEYRVRITQEGHHVEAVTTNQRGLMLVSAQERDDTMEQMMSPEDEEDNDEEEYDDDEDEDEDIEDEIHSHLDSYLDQFFPSDEDEDDTIVESNVGANEVDETPDVKATENQVDVDTNTETTSAPDSDSDAEIDNDEEEYDDDEDTEDEIDAYVNGYLDQFFDGKDDDDTKVEVNPMGAKPDPLDELRKKMTVFLNNPEIKDLIAENPHLEKAVLECMNNPLLITKYSADPEVAKHLPTIVGVLTKSPQMNMFGF